MYAMGLYSTLDKNAHQHAGDARDAAKFGGGTASFWRQYLIATLHLSGLCHEFDYAAPYPGHSAESKKAVTHDDMVTLAKLLSRVLSTRLDRSSHDSDEVANGPVAR